MHLFQTDTTLCQQKRNEQKKIINRNEERHGKEEQRWEFSPLFQ